MGVWRYFSPVQVPDVFKYIGSFYMLLSAAIECQRNVKSPIYDDLLFSVVHRGK